MATVTARKPRRNAAPAVRPPAPPVRAPRIADDYWTSTRRPFVCLVFLAPLLAAYEFGVLWLGDGREELLRNGADTWMRTWLFESGVHWHFALPVVVLGLLLIWNASAMLRWRVPAETLGGMLAESLIFAFTLVVVGQTSEVLCRQAGLPTTSIADSASAATTDGDDSGIDASQRQIVARAVTFVGAGIYEEVLFRLLLLPACYVVFRLLQAGPKGSTLLAITTTSLLFALAHYVGPAGEALVPYTFCFRAAAGVYFAALFLARGFGIAVGTHAAYDLIVGVLWVV